MTSTKYEHLFKQIIINSLERGYNQHSQLVLPKGAIALGELPKLCEGLGELLRGHYECTVDCVAEIHEDESWDIVAKDFWDEGEHPLGHRDRIVLGSGD